jgi:hypothetical protein
MFARLASACAIVGCVALAACDGQGSSPASPSAPHAVTANSVLRRSGALHVTKECPDYHGHANESCRITSSSLPLVAKGSTVVYASDAVGPLLDTDVTLYPPGGAGGSVAYGHCALSLATGIGRCDFSGGTGDFAGFRAKLAVSPLGGADFAWDGMYHLGGVGEQR